MQKPEVILNILNMRSSYNKDIKDIYRCLFNREWYILAYNNLYNSKVTHNQATFTAPNDKNVPLEYIDEIIDQMKLEKYKWHKPKNSNDEEWRDKLVQEVLRMILCAIYEPKFSEVSHGFRHDKGCHTALYNVWVNAKACEFFIYGNMIKHFNSIDHNTLLNILRKTIKDNRFIELIRKMLKADKFGEDFIYDKTYSGAPQGGILSPLLVNIYLNELDQYIMQAISPKWNTKIMREINPIYKKVSQKIKNIEKKLLNQEINKTTRNEVIRELKSLRTQLKSIPRNTHISKSNYRKLSYTRYANDWIISFTGTFNEAIQIKKDIYDFLYRELKLQVSDNDIRVTSSNDKKHPARFLGYHIITTNHTYNDEVALLIPNDVFNENRAQYMKNNKIVHVSYLLNRKVFDIIKIFQNRYRGLHQYYKFAHNQRLLNHLKYIMEISLVKTIANKLKITVTQAYKKYRGTKEVNGVSYKILTESISNEITGKIYHVYFGALPLKRQTFSKNNCIIDNRILR